ncbi:ionotropic receptor 93a [Pieris rapae]|uniref:ionotropic receptor 93a n=1 Tax=Pieris rapae TaxID=64459 RepID=UPI001E27DF9B|nr:ionotropic receptor 93a [Pieris rapae]
MQLWIVILCLLGRVASEDFPSLITSNASIAVVLDQQFLKDQYQGITDELKDYIKELARVKLKHGGVIVHYYSWTAINLKKGFLAVFSVTSCEDTWSLFKRVQDEQMLLFALTEVDCPRLPSNAAITVTSSDPGEELPQIVLDLRTEKAFNWKSAILLHDNTLSRDMISRVVQSMTSQIDGKPSISVTLLKMRHETNEYLRRKEVYRVLSKLPVKYIGENFIVIVTTDTMTTMAEAARDLHMSHTLAQWLYIVSDTNRRNGNLSTLINELFEGENIAYIYNRTDDGAHCQNGILCYCKELMDAFILALDAAVQEEFDVAAQVSDEEWEAIRPDRLQRRDMLLRHMQQHLTAHSKCGNCTTWQALAADTWGATYRNTDMVSNKDVDNVTTVIDNFDLLQVAFWRPIDGFMFEDALFPHIQHGFRGKELSILTYHNPPWTILVTNASGAVVNYGGLLFDIVGQFAKSKNFTIRIVLPGHVKEESSNETSTDMMHSTSAKLTLSAVAKGKVAFAAAAFTILSDPPPGINYTIPVSIQPYAFMVARPRELSRALLFLLPFTTDTWLCLGFAVIFMGPTLFIIHRISPFYDAEDITREGGLSTIHNCLWYVYGALLQQGGMYLPRADSGRLVVGTWWIVVLVVVTTYSGNLVAFLTFPKLEIPVTTINELLLNRASYTWSINKGSYLEHELKNSDDPKYVSLLKGAELTSSLTAMEANNMAGANLLNRVRKERHVMVDWKLRLNYIMRADTVATDSCDFVLGFEEFMEERIALIVPSASPYLPVINKEINRMQKAGLISKWLSVYLPKRDRCWQSSTMTWEVNNHTVNLSDMQGSFFVLFLGVLSATTVLLTEWFWNRRKRKIEQVVIQPYLN